MPTPGREARSPAGSPFQIAFARLRSDKIAMACFSVVLLFFLIAIFAPVLTRLFGVELRAGDPSQDTDIFNFPVIGPPDHPSRGRPRWAWRRTRATTTSPSGSTAPGRRSASPCLAPSCRRSSASAIGLIAGFSRGWLDRVISFVIDVFLALPFLLLALAVAPIIVLPVQRPARTC